MQSTRHSRQILMIFELSRHIFEKYLKKTYHKIRPLGAELFHPDGQT